MSTPVEMRRHPRQRVLRAVMIAPDGNMHIAFASDLSRGGVRMSLPTGLAPNPGMDLKMSFSCDADLVVLNGHVVRVASDHMGIAFDEAQEESVDRLLQTPSIAR